MKKRHHPIESGAFAQADAVGIETGLRVYFSPHPFFN
jgi:hypothetical protein